MDAIIEKKVNTWLNGNYDAETKQAIRDLLANNPDEITEAFYRDLEFGTGGLRGIMGVGTNRMNKYTVAMATQGLANYLKKSIAGEQIKVAVAYDSRNNSKYFSEITAEVLSANGIKVFLFTSLRPTPELSFSIRHLQCHSGIVITASHNPREYNGYKVYWADGGQLIPPHDKNTIAEVQKITNIDDVKFTRNDSLIEYIDKAVDDAYIARIKGLTLNPRLIAKHSKLKIVYTPLHGTGITQVPRALQEFGFENIILVDEQTTPDGNFPTVKSPNPEEKSALELALKKAVEANADLVLATDPDADRVGIAVKNHKGEFVLFNGNMTASLLFCYMIQQWKQAGKITGKEFIVKTIVTTELLKAIADKNGVETYDVLTGFKYIADIIHRNEGKKTFIVGGEESYGYLVGDFVRDKDAVSACCMIAELAAWAADNNKSLYDVLIDIYTEYGFYKEQLLSITRKGKSGAEEIKQMMENYRSNPPKSINNSVVVKINDYLLQTSTDLKTGKTEKITLPKSDVLQFFTEDGSKITVRPSGTEPKIKFYFGVCEKLNNKNEFEQVNALLEKKLESIIKSLNL